MKSFLIWMLALVTTAFGEDITTVSGETFKGIEVTGVNQYELTFSYSDGIATVPLASLPDPTVDRYSPGVDRSKDGRFWFERAQALYAGWQKRGAASGQKVEDVMAPVREHIDVIMEYADARTKAFERQTAMAPQKPVQSKKQTETGHHALRAGDVWRQLNTPGIMEKFLDLGK